MCGCLIDLAKLRLSFTSIAKFFFDGCLVRFGVNAQSTIFMVALIAPKSKTDDGAVGIKVP